MEVNYNKCKKQSFHFFCALKILCMSTNIINPTTASACLVAGTVVTDGWAE
jgi:hypothetical protein